MPIKSMTTFDNSTSADAVVAPPAFSVCSMVPKATGCEVMLIASCLASSSFCLSTSFSPSRVALSRFGYRGLTVGSSGRRAGAA